MRAAHHRDAGGATQRLRALEATDDVRALLLATRDPSHDIARRALGRLSREGGASEQAVLRRWLWDCDPALVADVAGALRALGDDQAVGVAIRRARSGPTAERCRAVRALERLGDRRAIPALREALVDPDASVRAAAADALRRIARDPATTRAVADLVRDPYADVRRRAVRALADIGHDVPPIVAEAAGDPEPLVRREVGRLAARLGDADVSRLLDDPDPHVRRAAVTHLGRARGALVIAVLPADAHPAVRLAAAETVATLDGEEASRALVAAAVADADAMVRARSLDLARDLLSPGELARMLGTHLAAAVPRHRVRVITALARIGGRIDTDAALRLAEDADPAVRMALARHALAMTHDPARILAVLSCDRHAGVVHAAALAEGETR